MLELLILLLSGLGLFLCIWILVAAPTFVFLVTAVAATELSPWFLGFFVLVVLLMLLRRNQKNKLWLRRLILGFNLIGIIICASPLIQVFPTIKQSTSRIQEALGVEYLASIPQESLLQMRPEPFVLADCFRGINLSEVRYDKGINFATPDGVPLSLDVYRPPQQGKYPTLIIIYGGAWQRGNPTQNSEFNRYMAARGYTVIAIDYRHAPRYRFPAQVEDVKAALAFIKQHASEYEVDLERVALLGRSAGAHLGMLTAFQDNNFPIRGIVSYYSPVDLTAGYNEPPNPDPINSRAVLSAFIGDSPDKLAVAYKNASPINHVKKSLPPTLLIYGGRDNVVQPKYGRRLYESLIRAGNTAIFLEIPWSQHGFDAVFHGVSNQLALYYTERFLGWVLKN